MQGALELDNAPDALGQTAKRARKEAKPEIKNRGKNKQAITIRVRNFEFDEVLEISARNMC